MDLAKKKIAILVDNFYQEMEVWYPLFRFQEAGGTVFTVGAKAGETYASKLGYPVKCQLSYDDVKAADFDGVRLANLSPRSATVHGSCARRAAC
jgi:protease I